MTSKCERFIFNTEENKIKKNKINFLDFFFCKENLLQKRKYFKRNIKKYLLLIEILLLFAIKLNLISSEIINIKRNIIFQYSSIKLKIENSGNHKEYSNNTYDWCAPVITPDETYINGKKQSEIKNEYYFENSNNEIILIWYNPLVSTTYMFRDCTSITEIDLSDFDDTDY